MSDVERNAPAPFGRDSPDAPAGCNRWLAIASTVSWVWTVLCVLIVGSILVGLGLSGHSPGGLVLALSVGPVVLLLIASGASAFGIRHARKPYNWIAVVTSCAWMLWLVLTPMKVTPVGLVLQSVVFVIVAIHWRKFE